MDTNYTVNKHGNDAAESTMKYVTFVIEKETYGVEALRVQEIIGMTKITEIPNAYHFMKGVINLRGTVVPVVDMRLKFNMKPRDYDFFTVIIIIEVQDTLVGMIVDTVSDVIDLSEGDIKENINMTSKIETDFIKGIANKDDNLIIILDSSRVLSSAEISSLEMVKAG
ncbi:MAG TPA: chemotaxis protein CheW [Spirochaetota bacterium]|nr:chemotaxis protein CheW [Spirochaetota bacterium]HPI88625.1 chemotaxis protein CheW [Spirochaetota bacterium]HPR48266.1 chemotaxis protein CheW [Spirochaetota bacterium]